MKSKKETQQELYAAHNDGVILEAKLNEVIIVRTPRANGSIREQQNFDACPTMAEQHTAHLTDVNYLINKFKPDELNAYLVARAQYRQEIVGHDFSQEPNLQEAKNVVYRSRQEFNELPDNVRNHFPNHLEFLKFIDNPANAEKMIKLGILTKRQIDTIKIPDTDTATPPTKKDERSEDAATKA